jgi:hypothetical protein
LLGWDEGFDVAYWAEEGHWIALCCLVARWLLFAWRALIFGVEE